MSIRIPSIRIPLPHPLLSVVLLAFLGFALAAPSAAQDKPMTGPEVQTANPMEVQPMGPAPDWAPSIDPQMLAVVEQLKAFEQPGFPEMTGFQARNAKTPAEAVAALMMKTGHGAMLPKVDTKHRVLPVGSDDGTLVRTYTPLEGSGPFPVIVYYHGGGWVIADLDTYEASAAALSAKTGAVVVSVAYRQAPESPYPAAHDDAFAAYKWVVEHAAQVNGDPSRIALAGESAGGNLAVAVAMRARDEGVALPVHILSVYPIADGDVESESYDEYADAIPLSRPAMEWFFDNYAPDWRTEAYPYIDLIDADLSGLPTTTVINAEIDPLASEGETLTERLEEAGVEVERELYEGVTHEFFGMAAVLEQAVEAQDYAASRLKAAFGTTGRAAGGIGAAPSTSKGMFVVSSGLLGPESAIHDADADVYLVSNVNGSPGEADGNGFISRISPNGEVLDLKWIDGADENVGLSAPKGLALAGDVLYVADLDGVHRFDRTTGEPLGVWATPDAQFLNAVSVGTDGTVYATDTGIRFTANGAEPQGTDKVYRWSPDGALTTMASGADLGGPNGIVADGSDVIVVTFGSNQVLRVNADGSHTVIATLPQGQLDGLTRLADGTHLVTSWAAKAVYHIDADGNATAVVENVGSPADIHVDAKRNRVLVPQLMENTLRIVPLPSDN